MADDTLADLTGPTGLAVRLGEQCTRRGLTVATVESIRSSRSSRAAAALSRLFSVRSPVQVNRLTVTPPASATAMYVRPTGFSAVPPSGPATPVTDTARSAPIRSRPPVAMATATWADTAPCADRTSSPTPALARFWSFE
ncbi:MAG TPA: hypothetical protein VF119_08280 [Candidatus Limnocylindrales bacterium]